MKRNLTDKETTQKEIGRIELSDNQNLVASLVDDEKLDLRIFVKTDSYTGPTREVCGFIFLMVSGKNLRSLLRK